MPLTYILLMVTIYNIIGKDQNREMALIQHTGFHQFSLACVYMYICICQTNNTFYPPK